MNALEELIKKRNNVAEMIRELIAERDAIGGRIGVLQNRLQELNDEVEYTKTEEEHERVAKEAEFAEVLISNDYSLLAREYRQLDREINKWRNCEEKYKDCDSYFQIGEVREQRRRVGDRMLELEWCEHAGATHLK